MPSHLNQDSVKIISAEFGLLEAATSIQHQWTKKLIVGRTLDLVVETASQHQD
jgi:hypothetical protein